MPGSPSLRFRLLLITFFLPTLVAAAAAAPPPKPLSVLWIVADDLGYADLSCYGSTDIPTPHIDSLAHAGLRLTSAYAYPTCSPTRAALLTGQYPERFGITSALMGDNPPPAFARATTLAQILHAHGYTTAAVGKWHLGYTPDLSPLAKGFDSFYGFRGGKIDFFTHTDTAQKLPGHPEGKHDFYDNNTEIFPTGQYTTTLFTARACTLLKQFATPAPTPGEVSGSASAQRARPDSSSPLPHPFFLYLAYNAPHYAKAGTWQAPDAYLKKFHAQGQTKGRGVYAAMVSCLDDSVGQVLQTLHDLHLDDNTLVLYTSDNGGEGPASNAPFRGGKHQFTEGGLRVNQIWRLPNSIPANTTSDLPLHVVDLTPTTLAALHIDPAKDTPFDGTNLWSSLTRADPQHATSNTPQANPTTRPIYLGDHALRKGSFKLLDNHLYDLSNDPQERKDLSRSNPDAFADLSNALQSWLDKLSPAPSAHWPTLADGELRYPPPDPARWKPITPPEGSPPNTAAYASADSRALMTIHPDEQSLPVTLDPDRAGDLARQIVRAITLDIQQHDQLMLLRPTLKRDPRFPIMIQDRIQQKDGTTTDRLHLYRPMGYFLTRVTLTIDTPPSAPAAQTDAAFDDAKDLLDRAVLGNRAKKPARHAARATP